MLAAAARVASDDGCNRAAVVKQAMYVLKRSKAQPVAETVMLARTGRRKKASWRPAQTMRQQCMKISRSVHELAACGWERVCVCCM